jgi:hypothetical protein
MEEILKELHKGMRIFQMDLLSCKLILILNKTLVFIMTSQLH